MIERRRLLFAAVGLLAVPSPAIVRAASLMPVSVVRPDSRGLSLFKMLVRLEEAKCHLADLPRKPQMDCDALWRHMLPSMRAAWETIAA